jgi:hypothetical protein
MRLEPLHRLAAAIFVMLAACAPSREDDLCRRSPGDVGGVDGGLVCGEPFDLHAPGGAPGRFALKVVQYLHLDAAGVVETDTIGAAVGWFDLQHGPDGTGTVALKLCHLDIPQVSIPGQPLPSTMALRPGALYTVPPPVAGLAVGGDRTCDPFHMDPNVVLIAARLTNSLDDPLPHDDVTQTCPGEDVGTNCLYDQDQDGKPAATLIAENLPVLPVDEVYVTLRSWLSLDGLVASSDLALGTATFGLEIEVVGCRIAPLDGGALRRCTPDEEHVVAEICPVVSQTPGVDSTFLAVRVAPDTECPYVIEHAAELFGR